MKNKIFIAAMLSLLTLPVFAQQKMVSEEAAIKKVIEDETMYFNQRNYEKWAECVAHDPMTYYTWTTPFAGENGVFEAKGWEEVSKAFKKIMEEEPPNENLSKKENYSFKINGNMAYITFLEDERTESVRVMEKKDGQWRILRMEALASKAFDKMNQLHALHRMAGNWEIDMSTFKKEGGGSWKMLGGTLNIERTPTGLVSTERFDFLNGDGEPRASEETSMISLNMSKGKIGVLNSVHYPYSNWTAAYSAEGEFDEDGALKCVGREVGGDDNAVVTMWMEGDMLNWGVVVKDEEGNETYSSTYGMRRAGSPKKVRP